MKEYIKSIKEILDEEKDEEGFEITKENFFENLKLCVKEKDYEGFDVLSKYFITYSLDDINPKEGKYNSEIRQYFYEMIMDEEYEFLKNWTDHEYVEVVNTIILDKMEQTFKDKRLEILSKEDRESLKESFLIPFIEFGPFTLDGILADKYEYFRSVKHKIDIYVYYSLSSLELMMDALMAVKGTGRDYIPNKKYTNEMFEFANELYKNDDKRLKQDEVIIETLKKFSIPIEKFDSFRVRWGVHNRTK
ncbi:MAG: hypothetical protein D8M26_11040 [Ignavibacteriae bacterium]|nr:hypothetical protein [Ignavibacteriota bacterium]